jgi:trimethylamine--corrinoid protein Co-methyltransferase
MKLGRLKVLSESEVKNIHDATIDILESCGVKISSSTMLDMLREKGLPVDHDSQVVRFPKSCIEESLAAIPRKFEVFDRTGSPAFVLGDRQPKIAAGHNAVFWVDSESGRTRASTVADVENFARICDQCNVIDMIGIPVMPQDVPDPKMSLLYAVRACVENSTKPIYFSTDNARVNRACIDILQAVFQGDLRAQVYGISQLSPTSPLFWERGVLDAIIDMVNTGVPIAVLPEPNAGVSAPYTLAGLLTVNNAECLSGLAIIQLLDPGHKVIYASSWTTTNMHTAAALVGSAETTVCRIAAAQLSQFYNVPSHTTAPNSDNHAHDEQNAWEKTFSQFCAVAAGHDLIVNCGMFATGMTFSNEQLLMDAEITALAKRIAAGISVTKDTIAADLIKQIGPRGETYLTTDHTLKWLRTEEYVKTILSVSGPRAVWEARGSKDTYKIAADEIRQRSQPKVATIPYHAKSRIDEILRSFS